MNQPRMPKDNDRDTHGIFHTPDELAQLAIAAHASVEALNARVANVTEVLQRDAVIATALNQRQFQVGDKSITSVDGSKITGSLPAGIITGDLPAAAMDANVVAAINSSSGGVDAGQITAGDLPAAQMQTELPAAWNASAGGYDGAKVDTGDIPDGPMTANLPTAFNASAGGFDATLVSTGVLPTGVMPNQGANATVPSATTLPSGTTYASDAAVIQEMLDAVHRLIAIVGGSNLAT